MANDTLERICPYWRYYSRIFGHNSWAPGMEWNSPSIRCGTWTLISRPKYFFGKFLSPEFLLCACWETALRYYPRIFGKNIWAPGMQWNSLSIRCWTSILISRPKHLFGKFLSPEFPLCACWETEYVNQVVIKCCRNFNLYDLCFRKRNATAMLSLYTFRHDELW